MIYTDSYTVKIWIAGNYADACRAVREFCERGSCWTVTPCEYIYTAGQESGVCITRINYPRFPATPEQIWHEAEELARLLLTRLYQRSFSIEATDKTAWFSKEAGA